MRDDVLATLNELIEACRDGEAGFKTCAEDIRDVQLKQPFLNLADGCNDAAQELSVLLVSRGGNPERRHSLGGSLHRRWIDIKSSLMGKDDEAIMKECERGEDMALKSYRRALEKDLPLDVRAVVERQYQGVIQNYELMKNLRNRAHLSMS
ncbi:PA2169 family four-helix-bundle protein [Herminiimonas glaciei]|uniref:PA2169 family four-helix-bundle protein n=1 Tax=Herminiimonas glaciei TaxID=523788 RepID=A0ABW2I7Q1_9BURK